MEVSPWPTLCASMTFVIAAWTSSSCSRVVFTAKKHPFLICKNHNMGILAKIDTARYDIDTARYDIDTAR